MSTNAIVQDTLDQIAAQERLYKDGKISREEYEARRTAILHRSAEDARPPRETVDYGTTFASLAPIVGVNFLLNVLTIGIYRFWGITRVRRHIWSRIRFMGDAFEYTGRPMELLIGLAIALAVLVPVGGSFYALLFTVGVESEASLALLQLAYAVGLYFLIQLAVFRARRYRFSRTRWRGIRAGQSGSAWQYAARSVGAFAVVLITLGLAYPWRNTLLYRYKYNNTWLGTKRFAFDGTAGALFPKWLITWLTFPFTLGLSYFWYLGHEYRYFASKTRYGDLRFHSEISGVALFVVYLVYGLALSVFVVVAQGIITAGFGVDVETDPEVADGAAEGAVAGLGGLPLELGLLVWYVVVIAGVGAIYQLFFMHALGKAIVRNLRVSGDEDFDAIAQSRRGDSRFGEGLADALDVGGL